MSSKGNSGLISRMVSLVTSPSRRGGVSLTEPGALEGSDQASIQAMMDRKVQNDLVRKREFEMLRQLRRHEPVAQRIDLNERTSMFQTSVLTKPTGRAQTIKKIDEIEQQMSQQWWKGKGSFPSSKRAPLPIAGTAAAVPPAPLAPMAVPQQPAATAAAVPTASVSLASKAGDLPQRTATIAPKAPPAELQSEDTTDGGGDDLTDTAQARLEASLYDDGPAFGPSDFPATMVEHFAYDPATEDAAIQFANGDFEGAASNLLKLIQDGKGQGNQEEVWLSLFDLYRSIGDRSRFDSTALEFAARYGRSAPQWGNVPAPAKKETAKPVVVDKSGKGTVWTAAAKLDRAGVARLQATLDRGAEPWNLNWSQLIAIEPEAATDLGQLFGQWAGQAHHLRFVGDKVLDGLLTVATPAGDRKVQPDWWTLRLNYLRAKGAEDAFELAALDFCITYEVSPPQWDSPKCRIQLDAQGAEGADFADSEPLTMGEELLTTLAGALPGANPWRASQFPPESGEVKEGSEFGLADFTGEITGDAADALARLNKARGDHEKLVVDCRSLVRMDFVAAGNLLNWAVQCDAQGCKLEFKNVNRLVATFLSVVGVDELVRIIPPSH